MLLPVRIHGSTFEIAICKRFENQKYFFFFFAQIDCSKSTRLIKLSTKHFKARKKKKTEILIGIV